MNQVKDWRILGDLQLFAVAGVLVQAQFEILVLVQVLLSPLLLTFQVPVDLLCHKSVVLVPHSPALATSRVTIQNSTAELLQYLVLKKFFTNHSLD